MSRERLEVPRFLRNLQMRLCQRYSPVPQRPTRILSKTRGASEVADTRCCIEAERKAISNSAKTESLLPCPFCGRKGTLNKGRHTAKPECMDGWLWRPGVGCNFCHKESHD